MTTLEKIKAMTDPFLNAATVSEVIGCDPNSLRCAAQQCPEKLGFPVTVIGRRVRIPRRPFLQYLEGGCDDG